MQTESFRIGLLDGDGNGTEADGLRSIPQDEVQ